MRCYIWSEYLLFILDLKGFVKIWIFVMLFIFFLFYLFCCVKFVVEMGCRYFLCYLVVIDKYVLDDDYVEFNDEGNIEEKFMKKRYFVELKDIF